MKLPTAEELYESAFYDKSYDSQHGFINMKQRVVNIIESHTAAHTAGLRERVKELEGAVVSELESILEQIQGVHSEYVEDVIKERISILKHGL